MVIKSCEQSYSWHSNGVTYTSSKRILLYLHLGAGIALTLAFKVSLYYYVPALISFSRLCFFLLNIYCVIGCSSCCGLVTLAKVCGGLSYVYGVATKSRTVAIGIISAKQLPLLFWFGF